MIGRFPTSIYARVFSSNKYRLHSVRLQKTKQGCYFRDVKSTILFEAYVNSSFIYRRSKIL
jgi:hypothetical protein